MIEREKVVVLEKTIIFLEFSFLFKRVNSIFVGEKIMRWIRVWQP